jgi:hypothetical protein
MCMQCASLGRCTIGVYIQLIRASSSAKRSVAACCLLVVVLLSGHSSCSRRRPCPSSAAATTSATPTAGRTQVRSPCNFECLQVGMDSDRIRTDTNSNATIYHILFWIRIQIRILSNANTKWIFRIRIHIRILTRFIA